MENNNIHLLLILNSVNVLKIVEQQMKSKLYGIYQIMKNNVLIKHLVMVFKIMNYQINYFKLINVQKIVHTNSGIYKIRLKRFVQYKKIVRILKQLNNIMLIQINNVNKNVMKMFIGINILKILENVHKNKIVKMQLHIIVIITKYNYHSQHMEKIINNVLNHAKIISIMYKSIKYTNVILKNLVKMFKKLLIIKDKYRLDITILYQHKINNYVLKTVIYMYGIYKIMNNIVHKLNYVQYYQKN